LDTGIASKPHDIFQLPAHHNTRVAYLHTSLGYWNACRVEHARVVPFVRVVFLSAFSFHRNSTYQAKAQWLVLRNDGIRRIDIAGSAALPVVPAGSHIDRLPDPGEPDAFHS
jgi:hypothetical protein